MVQQQIALFPFTKLILIAVICAGLQACAIDIHHGEHVTQTQADSFTVGVTTVDDVLKSLGDPSRTTTRPNGEKIIAYSSFTTRINPPSLATLTGASRRNEFVGAETTSFVFDTNSKLIRVEH